MELVYLKSHQGTSLAVQWLRLATSNAEGAHLIHGQGAKISHSVLHGQKIKEKKIFLNAIV